MKKKDIVSEKSTKAEILDAYQNLKKELDDFEKGPKLEKTRRVEPEDVTYTSDYLMNEITSLKIAVSTTIGDLESKLVEESDKLEEIKSAIREGIRRLKELHDIELEADSLSNLRTTQEDEKFSFEKEMEETKALWVKEKKEHDEYIKERDAALKRERQREEEEYNYQKKIRERKDLDALNEELATRKAAFEKEMEEREQKILEREHILGEREDELAKLKKEVEQFPQILDSKVKTAREEAIRMTEEQHKLDRIMLEKEMERTKGLHELTVKINQEKIRDQELRLKNLEKDLKEAQSQTHIVATKAVEGIAGIHMKSVKPEGKEKDES